jgi:predicted metal-binding membrane protein
VSVAVQIVTDLAAPRRMTASAASRVDRAPGLLASAVQVPGIALAIATAWVLIALVQLTVTAALLHHHALIEHGPPLWIAVPAFLVAWLVMIVAMMVPASLPAIAGVQARVRTAGDGWTRSEPSTRGFLVPFVLVWAGFGLAVFFGDATLHRVVDVTPWLAARPWIIDASVIGFAGLYQLLPIKQRSLDACRHPAGFNRDAGIEHALACLASSGGLMLLMFAEGFSSPWPMLGLTAVMAYEAIGRHGQRAAQGAGALLLAAAVIVVVTGTSI